MTRFVRLTIGLVISAVCAIFVFRKVPVRELWNGAASVSSQAIVACVILGSITLFLRSVRWRMLLEAAEPVPLGIAFAVNSAGQMGNTVLPARLGDLFRATNLGRAGLNGGFGLATVLVERVLDTGFLVLLSAVALTSFDNLPAWLHHAAWMLAAAAGGGIAVAVVLPRFEEPLLSLINRLLPERWRASVVRLAQQFLVGLRSLHDVQRVSGFLLLTAVIWLLDGAGFFILMRGLSLAVSPAVAAVLLASIGLSSAVPAAPGNVGVYQMVAVAVLAPFGVGRAQALAFTIVMQVVSGGTLIAWGLGSVWFLSARSRSVDTSGRFVPVLAASPCTDIPGSSHR